MLSAGRHHHSVPKREPDNLRFRKFVLQKADAEPEYREALIKACRDDILFYVNTFIWQHNPKKHGREVGPFISWDFQDEAMCSRDPEKPGLLWCIENDQDCLIEKSRDMGASWWCLIAFEWLWHFHPDKNFIVISRNEDAVDKKGWPSALFWKIDHIHKNLPVWLMPKGWEQKKHRTDLQFINPENRSVITGEASTGKAGVGGRATAMFIDEFSQIKEDREVLQRTADTTNCRIFNGTHVGVGTAFYRQSVRPDIKKIVMHWTVHPEKGKGAYHYDPDTAAVVPHDKKYEYKETFEFDRTGKPSGGPFPGVRSPWYDAECQRRGSERDVAMDLDIDCRGSAMLFFDSLQISELKRVVCCEPYWEGDIQIDTDTAQPKALVQVKDGPLKLWMNPTVHGKFPVGRYGTGTDLSWGVGATPSCFTAINADSCVKVLEYVHSRLKPEIYAAYVVALCRMLKNGDGTGALLSWESAGPGLQFGQTVIELGYRPLYYFTDDFDLEAEVSSKPGWYPNPKAKLSLLSDYRAAILNRQMENRSVKALEETLLFKYDDRGVIVHQEEATGKVYGEQFDPSTARINHADRVIADALAWKMVGVLGGRKEKKPEEAEAPVLSLQWRRAEHDKNARRLKSWI